MSRMVARVTLALGLMFLAAGTSARSSSLRFEVTIATGLASSPKSGRLFVVLSTRNQPEPRLTIGQTGLEASPVFARDIQNFGKGVTGTIDETCAAFPIDNLAHLPAGDYYVQGLFDSNIDLKSLNAPGNLYSEPRRVHLEPTNGATLKLELTKQVPDEALPPDTEYVRHVKIQSALLSKFHGRPMYLRAGLILPRGFDSERGSGIL